MCVGVWCVGVCVCVHAACVHVCVCGGRGGSLCCLDVCVVHECTHTHTHTRHRVAVRELFSDIASPQPSSSSLRNHAKQEEEDEEEEEGYFSTYSHFSIHEEMLKVNSGNS